MKEIVVAETESLFFGLGSYVLLPLLLFAKPLWLFKPTPQPPKKKKSKKTKRKKIERDCCTILAKKKMVYGLEGTA